jgi:hypothetical protein
MRRPRLWRDTGSWNDLVVSAAVAVGLAAWGGLGWWLDLPWLLLAAVFLGPASRFCLGLAVGAILCRFFSESRDGPP